MKNTLIIVGLVLNAVLGFAGASMSPGVTQNTLWEISCLSLVVSSVLLAARYTRAGHDKAGTGFTLLAIATAVMTTGLAGNNGTNPSAFAAAAALYLPALMFISVPKNFPIWSRIPGMLSGVVFGVIAYNLFTDPTATVSTNAINMTAHLLMTVALIGWIVVTARETVPSTHTA